VSSRRAREPKGWFAGEDGALALLGERARRHGPADGDGEASAEDDEGALEDDQNDGETLYRTEVVVDRVGEFVHPVTVELVFEDGERLRHHWDGRTRWTRLVEERGSRLAWAEVDPDHLMELDVDPLNNSRRVEPETSPAAKILVHLLFWLQNAFAAAAVVG
jgi:hypothetical protein